MRRSPLRFERDGVLIALRGPGHLARHAGRDHEVAAEVELKSPGIDLPRRFGSTAALDNVRGRTDDGCRDLLLQQQNVFQIPVVGLRPQMSVTHRIQQADGDTDSIAEMQNRSLHKRLHVQFLCNPANGE